MTLNKNLKICSIDNADSLKDLLISMGYSKSQLNKHLNKKTQNIIIKAQQEIELPVDLVNHGMISPIYLRDDFQIIYEDANFVALHKPHDLDGHSLNYSDSSCLSSLRCRGRFDLLKVNEKDHERGMLYRLDRVTSGVLVFAKSEDVFAKVRGQFSEVAKEKIYWAVVPGHVDLKGEFTHYFKAKGEKGSKMHVQSEADDRTTMGTLHILDCEYRGDYTRLTIKLISGLRHQIRAQLAFLGHPILGDTFYQGVASDRVYLHAHVYRFEWGSDDIEFVDPDFNWPTTV